MFLEHAPGADRPRDIEHLRRQSAIVEIAPTGGWSALPELAIDPAPARSRRIDVALVAARSREAVVVEIWDWFDDVGASLRGLDAKIGVLATRLACNRGGAGSSWRVRGLYVVRGTRRDGTSSTSSGRCSLPVRRVVDRLARGLRSTRTRDAARHGLLWSDASGPDRKPTGRRSEACTRSRACPRSLYRPTRSEDHHTVSARRPLVPSDAPRWPNRLVQDPASSPGWACRPLRPPPRSPKPPSGSSSGRCARSGCCRSPTRSTTRRPSCCR